MPNKKDIESLKLYHSLMQEAKIRALSINAITNNQGEIPSPLIREFCFLQLRMLCELIALGCLVAHGDIEASQSRDMQKAHDPNTILNRLETLHSDFYPVPVIPQKTESGLHLADYTGPPYLTKSDLKVLYGTCGNILHRWNVKRLIKNKSPLQINFSDVNDWGQKILNLLSCHRIISFNGQKTFVIMLSVSEIAGEVQSFLGEAPEIT